MSDAQFVVYNDAGIEQVSLGGINLALVQKVVINNMASWTAINGPRSQGLKYTFNVTAVNPVIAIATGASGATGAVFATITPNGSGNWTVSLYGGASTPSVSTPGATTLNTQVNVYVFDLAPAPASGSGYGLVLFNAAGQCMFNATYPAARIKGMVGTSQNPYGYGTSMTVPSGSTYASVLRSTFGEMFVESYNNTTGQRLVYDWRMGVSGGFSGASISMGSGLPSLLDGAVSTTAGTGAAGNLWLTHGCNAGGSSYFSDAMVLDVTNL